MALPNGYSIREGFDAVDFELVHSWLTNSYWSPGVSVQTVRRAAHNSSLVLSAYLGPEQVGYLRVVSDRETFAWLCDVWVAENRRGKGLAKALVNHATEHPDHTSLRRWVLATRDAHDIYQACGFAPLPERSKWMVKVPNG
jgi:GNAT superfamily N-acetyltransferase